MNKYERTAVAAHSKAMSADIARDKAAKALKGKCTHPEAYREQAMRESKVDWTGWYVERCRLCGLEPRYGVTLAGATNPRFRLYTSPEMSPAKRR